MTHHAGKRFVFLQKACTISQCVGPKHFLWENMGWKSSWLAEDLSLAGALRLKLLWQMEMVYTVLPPGLPVGARGKETLSAFPSPCALVGDPKPTLASLFFFFCIVSKQYSLFFMLFHQHSNNLQSISCSSNLCYKWVNIYNSLLHDTQSDKTL